MIASRKVALPIALVLVMVGCGAEGGGGEAQSEAQAEPAGPDMTPTVVLETSMGRIVMELDREKAPRTVANFLAHMQGGFYNGLIFHRVMPDFMIQAGLLTADYAPRRSTMAYLQNEGDNGLLNARGSVAMARGSDPHSAKAEFFINVKDNAQLDTDEDEWGYAVFGRVVEGMDIVDAIRKVPTRARGKREDVPVDPITIERAYVAEEEEKEEGASG